MNQQGWMKVHHKRLLDKGKIEKRVLALRFYGIQQLPKSSRKFAPRRITLSGMVNVCVIQRMRYPKFRRQHLIVGSGVIKAGCKTVIGCRLRDPVCSGPSAVPTRSSPYAAATSTADARTTGNPAAGSSDFQFHVAHPLR